MSDMPATMVVPEPVKPYKAGTLQYTRAALLTMFFWILLGDFSFTVMMSVMNSLTPVTLKALGASSAVLGLLLGSIPNAMSMVLSPVFSTWSDRYRSSMGRRRPFLLWTAPPVAICLVLIGYSGKLAPYFYGKLPWLHGMVTQPLFSIILVGVFVVAFMFFLNFTTNIFFYLVPDVVPDQVMGKFMSCFRVAGLSGGFVFNQWVLSFGDKYPGLVYVATGLFYMVAFLLLSWQVKEGEYPPPPVSDKRTGMLKQVKLYLKESFSAPFYRLFFCANSALNMITVLDIFLVLVGTRTLGLSMGEFGKVIALGGVLAVPMILLAGALSDRFHPMRVMIPAIVALALVNLGCFLFIQGRLSFSIGVVMLIMVRTFLLGVQSPLFPRIMARSCYGQLCSANGICAAILSIPAPILCGKFLDVMHSNMYLFLWVAVFTGLAGGGYFLVYRQWKKLGGNHYLAPEPHIGE